MTESNERTIMILQCITIAIVAIKPVLMYFIQAKYNAPPPHESILRNIDDNKDDKVYEYKESNV